MFLDPSNKPLLKTNMFLDPSNKPLLGTNMLYCFTDMKMLSQNQQAKQRRLSSIRYP